MAGQDLGGCTMVLVDNAMSAKTAGADVVSRH